jgi:hypothetical protein
MDDPTSPIVEKLGKFSSGFIRTILRPELLECRSGNHLCLLIRPLREHSLSKQLARTEGESEMISQAALANPQAGGFHTVLSVHNMTDLLILFSNSP